MNTNLYSVIKENIVDQEKTFAETQDGQIYSYADLDRRSAQFAEALVDLGVLPGDRVAAQIDKSIEAIFLYLGCLRAGAIYLPLNTGYTASEINYFLRDASPKVAVCRPEIETQFREIAIVADAPNVETFASDGTGSIIDLAATKSGDFDTVDRSPEAPAAILYTSGTTGRSKGAMLTHGNLGSNAQALANAWRFTSEDVLLHALPIFHIHGLFVAINITLFAGSSLIFLPGFDLAEILHQLPRSTVMMGVPTFYTRLLRSEAFDQDLVSQVRLFVSGSAPLSPETHKEFELRTGHAILERYGMTETNMNTTNPYSGERRAGTVGMPLEGIEVRITDPESGNVLKQGEVGMIEIKGPNVFKRYWRMPEKTEAKFREDGFFISGDLGKFDAQGYLHIVGRDKDLIISGGYNVYPAEVEAALDAIDGIAESAVVGVPHQDFGEGVTAVVVARDEADLSEDHLKKVLTDVLAKYKIPKRIICVDRLPRNAMGKVQKKDLRESYSDIYR